MQGLGILRYARWHERHSPERRLMRSATPLALTDALARYWRNNLVVTAVLLAVWFGVTFVVSYFARELSFTFFGWPFSFWVAAQGALIVYVLIVGGYAWYMNRADHAHGVAEPQE